MKASLLFGLVLCLRAGQAPGQPDTAGFRHIRVPFQGHVAEVLVQSAPGSENTPKPLLFFCQGSRPKPLLIYDDSGTYGVFPFRTEPLTAAYHLVIVGKPGVPLAAAATALQPGFLFADSAGRFPAAYVQHNLPAYYVARNAAVIRYLQRQPWAKKAPLVVAGHSEGSTIAARMAVAVPGVTHLIYAGGSPLGRMLGQLVAARRRQAGADSAAEGLFTQWQHAVAHRHAPAAPTTGDTDRATYAFNEPPPLAFLKKLNIPMLVVYGTRDDHAVAHDYLRLELIRLGRKHFTFQPWVGTDHNFFPVGPDGTPDLAVFNWDRVAEAWANWLKTNPPAHTPRR